MTLSALLAPIASATIVNVFLFAIMWRGDRLEARTGRSPWYVGTGIVLYAAVILAVIYAVRDAPTTNGLVLFVGAAGAETFGVLIAMLLHHAFIKSQGAPLKDRAFAMAASLFLTFIMVAGLFGR